ncbi:patched domain-containing protein 3-like [Tiliqua scincoides]|uniref:patched domain-containing protein 3-like n=1 Tax=Tiliqua scincoides TaxID=71010 RepID=UPI003463472B
MRRWRFRTSCVEGPLRRALRALGAAVGAHPWPFLLLPLALSGGLSVGFHYLSLREYNDIERQYTPVGSPAKGERRFVRAHYPTRDGERFSAQRLISEGSFVSLLAVAAGDRDSLLTREALAELLALDRAVRALSTPERSFAQLCARSGGACSSPNPLLDALQGRPESIEALLPGLTWPLALGGRAFLPPFLGGVKLAAGGSEQARPLLAAKALRLFYFLQEDEPAQRSASKLWLGAFLQRVPDILAYLNLSHVQVAHYTSLSRQEEFEKSARTVIPFFSTAYTLTIVFSVLSCARLDSVRTKVWVAAFGVLTSALSVLSGFGLLLLCGVPLILTAAHAPFLILGVGVDDMFILVSCWQHTKVKDSVKDRMAETYAEAAISVTITTLTDVLAFYIGTASAFPSVQSFCVYTGTAFVFCYVYNLTFLGAILALNGRREESNRHWLTFMKVETEPQDSRGRVYNRCCIGGSFDEATGAEIEHPMNGFFKDHYGPFLMHPFTKAFVVILYALYLSSSVYACTQVKEGIDLRNTVSDDSYLIRYYDWAEKYFEVYGLRVMVVVTKSIAYWDSSVRADLEKCMDSIEHSKFVDKKFSESWLRMYETIASRLSLNLNDRSAFIGNLPVLFNITPESKWDIIFSNTEIKTSRFYVQTVNVKTALDEKNLLIQLRRYARKCKIPMLVFHPAFIYFDQFIVIVKKTLQTVGIATGTMLIISLLLIPNPLCSLWVTFAIASVIVGVTGFMAYWDVSLDPISMINLIICIGFSVDFSAHISYAFVSSEEPEINDKAVDALYRLGYPVVQGAVSTIVGVVVLSVTATYIFRTFFKIMFLVMAFGAIHGLVFIPVFLTFFGICTESPQNR